MKKPGKVVYSKVDKVEVSSGSESVQVTKPPPASDSKSCSRMVSSPLFGAIMSLLIFDIFFHLLQYFPSTKDSKSICESEESISPSMNLSSHFQLQNIVMVKPGKVGGSTLSGVIRHIGAHYGLSGYREEQWIESEPGIFAEHMNIKPDWFKRLGELKMQTFLVTIIRHPIDRCLSDFHYFRKHGFIRDADSFKNMTQYFYRYCTNYMIDYISDLEPGRDREKIPHPPSDKMKRRDINNVISTYDFIGITGRFNETMVLMKHLLGLQWRDVLYIPAKITTKEYKSFSEESKELHDYVKTDWKKFKTNKDFYLYDKVMEEFDRKTAAIPSFEADLKKYEMLLDTVTRICGWLLPSMKCVSDEEKDRCNITHLSDSYIKDAQRGYACLDLVGDVERFF